MPSSPDRIDPNRPGLDPVLAFSPPAGVPMNPKSQPAVAYTLKGEDYYRTLVCNAAAATTITVPTDAAMGEFPVAGLLRAVAEGATLTIVAAAGVTLTSFPGVVTPLRVGQQTGQAVFQKTGPNAWYVFGDLAKA